MTEKPRAMTEKEVRNELLDRLREIAKFWASNRRPGDLTILDRTEGAIFSVLVLLDGLSDLPPFTLVVDDHDQHIEDAEEGKNWIEPGTVLGSAMLHEHFLVKGEAKE